MYRVEQFDSSEYVVWAGKKYAGSLLMASNGLYEYFGKNGQKFLVMDPWSIPSILEKNNQRMMRE